jgi:methyl-accepting chemotaxis protein
MSEKKGRSLKFKLIALSLGITFLLGFASLGVLKFIINSQEKVRLNGFEANAHNLSDSISAQFFERYGDVQAFALNPDVRSPSRETIVTALNNYSALYLIYDLIMVVDAQGKLVAVNNKTPEGKDLPVEALYLKNYSKAPWFKAVMSGQLTENKDKGFLGTYVDDVQVDPWVSKTYKADRLGTGFSAPIRNAKGDVIGVITNRAGSRWFEVAFREIFSGIKSRGFPTSELQLLGKDGTLLYSYSSDPGSDKLADSRYDWNELLKLNLAASSKSAQRVVAHEAGSMIENHYKTGVSQIIGYSPVTGPKFLESLGWSVLVQDSEEESMRSLRQAEHIFYAIFTLVIALTCAISYFFSRSLSTSLSGLAQRLSAGSTEVLAAASSISRSSTELSEASVEQASAIQQTAASIDQVSSMVKKSADNATQSQSVSQSSRSSAEQGQEAMKEMTQAINEISQSNIAIMTQVEEGNRQISEIVKVIGEIGNKTKVINDIVFQTKLLSFNASVEAARAGEHGKGFAVVAEEVGNLAQMSGNAAKEISSMLDSSIQKVEGIVTQTKTSVERLVQDSRAKVEAGTRIAAKCGEVLGTILNTVQEVDGMVGEISSASQEQAQGVSEINKAMNQLDQVTQQNTGIAQSAASSAEQLNAQANQLRQMVRDLFMVVNGTDRDTTETDSVAENPNDQGGPAHAVPRERNSTVVTLQKARADRAAARAAKAASPATSRPLKTAAGAEPRSIPSKDDPRFEDV